MVPEFIPVFKFLELVLGGTFFYGGYILFNNGRKLATATVGSKIKGTGVHISKKCYSQNHIVVIAPTREHKTTSFYVPNLLENNIKGSFIISDPKGELYNLSHKYQENIGRKTILFNPLNKTVQYNPLQNCKNDREIMQLAQNLLINGNLSYEISTGKKGGSTEWLQMSQSLLCASLMYKNTISSALSSIVNSSTQQLDILYSHAKDNVKTQYNAFKMCLESPKTMASIKSTLVSTLSLFTDNLAIDTTDFTAEQLKKEPTALYISYPENKANYLAPFMSCFYSQLIDHLIDTKGLPTTFYADEFCNIGQLSNFATNISTCASRDIQFVICLQSISQLEQIYGKYNALTILNNCKTKCILPSNTDMETLDYISRLTGTEQILINERQVSKPLFTADELRRLQSEKVLVISDNNKVFLDTQNIYFKQSKYKERV